MVLSESPFKYFARCLHEQTFRTSLSRGDYNTLRAAAVDFTLRPPPVTVRKVYTAAQLHLLIDLSI